jgi:hypothetical protein
LQNFTRTQLILWNEKGDRFCNNFWTIYKRYNLWWSWGARSLFFLNIRDKITHAFPFANPILLNWILRHEQGKTLKNFFSNHQNLVEYHLVFFKLDFILCNIGGKHIKEIMQLTRNSYNYYSWRLLLNKAVATGNGNFVKIETRNKSFHNTCTCQKFFLIETRRQRYSGSSYRFGGKCGLANWFMFVIDFGKNEQVDALRFKTSNWTHDGATRAFYWQNNSVKFELDSIAQPVKWLFAVCIFASRSILNYIF